MQLVIAISPTLIEILHQLSLHEEMVPGRRSLCLAVGLLCMFHQE